MASSVPQKDIPIGDISDLLLGPFDVLLKSPDLSAETKAELSAALTRAKGQRALINNKFIALNQQVQCLLAQFDWTKAR